MTLQQGEWVILPIMKNSTRRRTGKVTAVLPPLCKVRITGTKSKTWTGRIVDVERIGPGT